MLLKPCSSRRAALARRDVDLAEETILLDDRVDYLKQVIESSPWNLSPLSNLRPGPAQDTGGHSHR